MQHVDFLAIGDITTDAFIRLKDADVHCDIDKANCKLCVSFGDKIPFEEAVVVAAVGNSPNAAVSAARLGLSSGLIAWVGDDRNGEEDKDVLKNEGVSLEYIFTAPGLPTNYHYVLWYDVDRTILVKHAEFPYALPKDMPAPKWLYLSSLGENSLPYHLEIAEYLKAHPETKLAFQPGTFQMKLGTEKLKDVYANTEIFFCNLEEAQRILGTGEKDPKILMAQLRALGPKKVVVTDGPKGLYADDGEKQVSLPMYPGEPYERTGAGDACSSTITAALALGHSFEDALLWGPINSASVVKHIGAQKGLLSREKLEEMLANAPKGYQIKEL